jgi:hypothetical protein
MIKHLASCPARQGTITSSDAGPGESALLYHLQVRDAWSGEFWLNLEVRGSATLDHIDRYLRAIWLECCGHMSRFSFGGWSGEEISKRRRVERVFEVGAELTHIYDFGTESVTLIKAVDLRKGKPTTRHPIALMARNLSPEEACIECGAPAKWLCVECLYEDDVWGVLCDEHAETHPHDNYGEPMPLVNSPRVGMCGDVSPAESPY